MARRAGGPLLKVLWALRAIRAVLPHPSLWRTGLRQLRVLARPGWWRRPPFLPLPAPDYLRFRLETAYGGQGDREPDAVDLLTYLQWCRRFPG
jgi:hypothetical protein